VHDTLPVAGASFQLVLAPYQTSQVPVGSVHVPFSLAQFVVPLGNEALLLVMGPFWEPEAPGSAELLFETVPCCELLADTPTPKV
jgi:hypothetical protein